MKLKRQDLTNALQSAAKCLGRTIPITACFKLDLEADSLTVTATDIDSSVRLKIPAENGITQSVCTDGKSLTNILARLNDDVVLDIVKNDLVIKRKAGNIKLRTSPAEKFPAFPEGKTDKVKFKANEFAQVCVSALLGTTEDDIGSFAYKNIAQLTVEKNLIEGKFRCATTDKQRIAISTGLCDAEEDFVLQLPIQALRTLGAVLKNQTGDVCLGEDPHHLFVQIGDSHFAFRKIAAEFPNFDTYLNMVKFDRIIKVDSTQLKQSLELINQVINKDDGFTMSLNGKLTLLAGNADIGEIEESIETAVDFEAFETRYNISYVLPLIKAMSGEIELQFALDPHGHYPLRVVSSVNNVTSSFDIQSRNF